MTGYDARPRWLLRPRKNPLPRSLTKEELLEHQLVEKGLAAMKSGRLPEDQEIKPADDVEQLAEQELARKTNHD